MLPKAEEISLHLHLREGGGRVAVWKGAFSASAASVFIPLYFAPSRYQEHLGLEYAV